ncbi:hypothetical protein GTO36_03940, partial [bacterium]|nr:hypothetical protein [bacterium]
VNVNQRIQKFTSDGTFVTKWGSYGTGDGQFEEPYDVAVDSSGYVYVADCFNHRIQKFTSDGTFVTKFGSYGTEGGFAFKYPYGVGVDSSGNVYVCAGNNCIQKFRPASSGAQQFTQSNHNILNKNLSINKGSNQKSYNNNSSLQNKQKQMMQIKRKDKDSEKRK